MCGISAIINTASKPVQPDLIRKMNMEVKHRGPDGESFFFDGAVALGHRMLKIMDLGPGNVQPMKFKDYVISYNGEIYNFREIRHELIQLGYQFKTETDTEVLLAAYDAWKEDCVHHLNGMWAFVLYDQQRKMIFCSRDRFGIKPLCYTYLNDKFLVGSEIKQFTVFNDFNPKLNHRVAFDFLYFGRLNTGEESMFENVRFLPAGSNLFYDLSTHTFKINKWYQLKCASEKLDITLPEAIVEFRNRFTDSMLHHLYSRVSLGSCLSGGADSTSMVGIASEAGVHLNTYSSCFLSRDFNEIDFINAAVDFYQVPNYKIYPDMHELISKDELDKLVYQQDQPITCGSFFTEYKIYNLAASHHTRVILGGGGADEYLGGYGEFSLVFLKSLIRRRKLMKYASEFLKLPRLKIRITEMLRTYLRLSEQGRPDSLNFQKNSFKKEWFNENFSEQESPLDKIDMEDLSIFELKNYSLPHQLHSEDRSSMHFSLESRLPFLDHRLVEFCLSLPDEYKLKNGITKYILKESMRSVLPPAVYQRKSKLGMPGPEVPLFESHLPEIKENYKELIRNYPDLFGDQLLTMLDQYAEGKIPYHNFLFRVLSFGAWARRFNISSGASATRRRSSHSRVIENMKATISN